MDESAAFPRSLPTTHRVFLKRAHERLAEDSRIVGVAAAGSFASDSMDALSDLDLVIVAEPAHHEAVMSERAGIAASLGDLLACFTGDHVGEPRLLICLYDAPLLHVDLKFVKLEDAAHRVDDPVVLWQRNGRLSEALGQHRATYPQRSPQWIEDRFWIWIHYGAGKIARGELFEALDFLSALRGMVLGPMILARAGAQPIGVRKIEQQAPLFIPQLERTVARYEARDCIRALKAAADLYRLLAPVPAPSRVEGAVLHYVAHVEDILARA